MTYILGLFVATVYIHINNKPHLHKNNSAVISILIFYQLQYQICNINFALVQQFKILCNRAVKVATFYQNECRKNAAFLAMSQVLLFCMRLILSCDICEYNELKYIDKGKANCLISYVVLQD